ncbi:acylneuraminate cytidylyltransferase family protein [Candidatus Pseudothioglobus sp. Uisw_041]|jgi:CMP-N,N'-diacetyllegionaminic acid synthase|uniref:acylneuraminate cytidylyltransferase family protein n=1 Tax=Candidatus Pseudothioglobus sp. Uisw_041 TaxID=3230996 RepID=UPI003A8B0CDB
MNKIKYTAFVPARSGSKRLPGKNIKLLAGKPLVVWTLEAFINSSKVGEVIFSTDSMEYWQIVKEYIKSDKLILDFRSSEEAGDSVKIFDYLKNENKKIFDNRDGVFILALPTAPFRTTAHINEAIDLYETLGKPVFSAVQYGFSISFAFTQSDNNWQAVFEDSPMITGNTRSQDQAEIYHPNGAIYLRPINDLRSNELTTLYEGAIPYIMSDIDSADIDNEIDFMVAAAVIKSKKTIN